MSRSKRQIQITGITCAKSDKDDKQRAAMRERKSVNDKIKVHAASDDFELPDYFAHPRSGQYSFAKDGKYFHAKPSSKVMRK